jgi:methionyl-tRNA formyltransferase
MGTAELACPSLQALCRDPAFTVLAAVTQPDRPKGRDLKPQPSALKQAALALGLPVLQPEKARDPQFLERLRALRPDLMVVAAYGQLLPPALLEIPPHGCVNVHTSLLPKYRGAAPIQWALLHGDAATGVTIMRIDAGLDTGPILSQRPLPIHATDNAETLHDRLAQAGAALLIETVKDYVAGRVQARPQPSEGASYARKITKEDGHLEWSQPASQLWNRLRALTPWPGAFTFRSDGPNRQMLKIWDAEIEPTASGSPGRILRADKSGLIVACGQGGLRVRTLQREGGRRMSAPEFLAGHRLEVGEHLT